MRCLSGSLLNFEMKLFGLMTTLYWTLQIAWEWDVTEEQGGLDIVWETLESIRGGGSPQSEGGNIPSSHDWDGLMAQHLQCKEKIDLNYARIGSIEEDMRLSRDQMFNA